MIRRTALFVMAASALMLGQDLDQNKPRNIPKAPPPRNAPALTVPAGAKEVEPFLYRFTDAHGKNWMYRQTPFGVVRWEEKAAQQPVVDNSNPVAFKDLGDSVEFSTQTPFGVEKWKRKKSELTSSERAIYEGRGSDAQMPGKPQPADSKPEKQ